MVDIQLILKSYFKDINCDLILRFKNGEPIEIDKRIKFEDQGKLHRLIIEKTVPEDSGKFRITLKNKLGEISQEGQLTVKGIIIPSYAHPVLAVVLYKNKINCFFSASTEALVPIVMKKLEDVVCIMGNHANFEAKIYANPDPEIYWLVLMNCYLVYYDWIYKFEIYK